MKAEQKRTDDLKKLPSVGVSKEQILKESGYETFKDIVKASPFEIEDKTGIVRASAVELSSSAVKHINGTCPECDCGNFDGSQSHLSIDLDNIDSDIVCSNCHWDGYVDDI